MCMSASAEYIVWHAVIGDWIRKILLTSSTMEISITRYKYINLFPDKVVVVFFLFSSLLLTQ